MSRRVSLCDLKPAVRRLGAAPGAPLALALWLAACSSGPDLPVADMPKAIHVEHARVQYDAAFAPGTADLPPAQAAQLDNFLDRSNVRPGDPVYVATPAGDPLAAEHAGRIAFLLGRRGLAAVSVAPPPSGVLSGHVLVLADRYVAAPPACPDWSDDPTGSHSNAISSSNYGCATMTDFSLMIDNPRDLVTGRELGPAAGDPAADAVERYRTGTVKPFPGGAASGGAAPSSAASSGSSYGGSSSGGSSSGGSASGGGGTTPAAAAASSASTSPSATMLNTGGGLQPQ